jgi:hypothetical protein
MITSKSRVLAVALFLATTTLGSTVPVVVHGADADILRDCIVARSDESNQEIVRSECMWKHWAQMASWGR